MTPRKGSSDLGAAKGNTESQHQRFPQTPTAAAAAKGKGKARGGKVHRSKALRDDDDDFDCADDSIMHDYDDAHDSDDADAAGAHDEAPKRRGAFLDFGDADIVMDDEDGEDIDCDDEDGLGATRTSDTNQDSAKHAERTGLDRDAGDNDDGDDIDDGEDAIDRFDDEDDDEGDEDDEDEDEDDPYGDARDGMGAGAFGLNLRAMAGYMSGLSGRFRGLLSSLRDPDPTVKLVALQELSELLSVSTEDTLAGYFPTDSFVKELIYAMGGPKPSDPLSGKIKDADAVDHAHDEDEEMAAAIAAAAAADFEDSGEKELLACRCLANLIEAMPYAAHSVVTHGAIPVLNSKLMEITFIDLAEQVLQTLEKISQDYPGSIVKERGLSAILQYLDFFNIHIQRTAMTAAANCCRKLSVDSFSMVKEVMPTIQNVLTYSDQRLVESACKCVVRAVDSYKYQPDLLEQLLGKDLLAAVNNLLLPAAANGGSGSATTLSTNIYTDVLKALGTACRASPKVAVALLDNHIVETLYHLLTGSPAPPEDAPSTVATGSVSAMELESETAQQGGADHAAVAVVSESGATTAVAEMAVLQNLAQRPKEQVQEALSLIGELLPPLPRDGVFDSRAYSERAYLKRKSQQQRANRSSSGSNSADGTDSGPARSTTHAGPAEADGAPKASSAAGEKGASPSKPEKPKSERELVKEAAQAKRTEMLKSQTQLVKRFTQLVLPTLVEVYAASVALHVRTKSINGILKILSFVEPDSLLPTLDHVPLASFVAAILSSRDHPSLVNSALQIVELLTIKLPDVYTALLRREGVMWEIEDIASKEPSGASKTRKKSDEATKAKSEPQLLSLPGSGSGLSSNSGSAASNSSTVVETPTLGSGASSGLARLLAATAAGEGLSGALMSGTSLGATGSAISRPTGAAALEAEADANIWRARVLRDKFNNQAANSEGTQKAVQALDHIKALVKTLETAAEEDESVARQTIDSLTQLFSRRDDPISSFELLRSGLVEGLYAFATKTSDGVPLERRRSLLIESLMRIDDSGNTAASVLVRRLQESISRLENVEITTALSGGASDDSRRSPSAMLGRQLRLRLQAEDSTDIPRTCTNIVVTIHAVATFQSLNDYLRPKIAASAAAAAAAGGGSSGMSSRLSGVLAAFAAATGSGGLPELGAGSSSTSRSAAGKDDAKPKDSISKEDGRANADESKIERNHRRRSSRLSGKSDESGPDGKGKSTEELTGNAESSDSKNDKPAETSAADKEHGEAEDEARAIAERLLGGSGADDSEDALAQRLMEGLLQEGGLDEGFSDEEEFEGEILQNEIAADAPGANAGDTSDAGDKTINLDIDKEAGGKVVAKTPDGTRISTPSAGAGTPKPSHSGAAAGTLSSSGSPSKPSYASALQKKPSDWHLEFWLGNERLTFDTTIYGAIHRFETSPERAGSSSGSAQNRYIWGNIYTIKYKKVPGPVPSEASRGTPEPTEAPSPAIRLPASIKPDAPYAKLLQLLAVLHDLNAEWREVVKSGFFGSLPLDAANKAGPLAESAFVNNKLTAKLNRQLEEPMIVASSCLPGWSTDLPKVFPFLFPFEARFSFLQSTAFGYARLITRWQNLHSRNQDNSSSSSSLRLDDSFGFLGRLQRQKVRISRSSLLASAFKVFELYGSNSSVLEVEYFEEVGTGLGPTLEFYSLVSKEFARKDLGLWRDSDGGNKSEYVSSPLGLFPAPFDDSKLDSTESKRRLHAFRILGQFVAKALLDSRIIDCHFSAVFMRAVLNQPMPTNLATLGTLDPTLAKSLSSMQTMSAEDVESLALDFTMPGYPELELHPGGRDEAVNGDKVDQYVSEVLAMGLDVGVRPAVRAFRQGFNLIFPIAAMSSFTADELVMLFGNSEEDWSEATLMASIKPDHGLNTESTTFQDIVAIMSGFSVRERRNFLQWLTGSPKLPIGGFAGLHPQLTIVKRPHEAPLTPDDYLPSVMTCVNYLKMPSYSSRDKMRERLETAMKEGSTSFHLS